MPFKKVSEQQMFLRALLYGAPGSGKTLSSLILAKAISEATGKPVALLDTEAGRSSHKLRCPQLEGFTWDCDIVEAPNSQDYVEAIKEAIACGYGTIILDSISPEWESVMSSQNAYTKAGVNNFQAWGKAKVPHKEFISMILSAPINIIATARSKADYVVENGKPQRVGLAPIQDPSITYNFDVVLLMESGGIVALVEKDETGVFTTDSVITPEVATKLVSTWLSPSKGAVIQTPQPQVQSKPQQLQQQPQQSEDENNKLKAKYISRIKQLADQLGEYVDEEELQTLSLQELQSIGKTLKARVDAENA